MKKTLLFIIISFTVFAADAQRFFYLDSDNTISNLLRYDLIKYSQFVAETPLASDYIVKMKACLQTVSNKMSLDIRLQDSITLETIYQTNEEYSFPDINKSSKIFLKSAIQSFVDRNVDQIIIYAKDDHYDSRMKFLKPRKDKPSFEKLFIPATVCLPEFWFTVPDSLRE